MMLIRNYCRKYMQYIQIKNKYDPTNKFRNMFLEKYLK